MCWAFDIGWYKIRYSPGFIYDRKQELALWDLYIKGFCDDEVWLLPSLPFLSHYPLVYSVAAVNEQEMKPGILILKVWWPLVWTYTWDRAGSSLERGKSSWQQSRVWQVGEIEGLVWKFTTQPSALLLELKIFVLWSPWLQSLSSVFL